MAEKRPARDYELLDAIDALDRTPFEGSVWRVVRNGRDPVQGLPSGGRWDPGVFDVLYTSCQPDGAIAEMHFHLTRQPVFPSGVSFALHEIVVRATSALRLPDMAALRTLGVEETRYREILYRRTQEIGDAAFFLGFDCVIAPNARWPCLNAVFFSDRIAPDMIGAVRAAPVDWEVWRESVKKRPTQG